MFLLFSVLEFAIQISNNKVFPYIILEIFNKKQNAFNNTELFNLSYVFVYIILNTYIQYFQSQYGAHFELRRTADTNFFSSFFNTS